MVHLFVCEPVFTEVLIYSRQCNRDQNYTIEKKLSLRFRSQCKTYIYKIFKIQYVKFHNGDGYKMKNTIDEGETESNWENQLKCTIISIKR